MPVHWAVIILRSTSRWHLPGSLGACIVIGVVGCFATSWWRRDKVVRVGSIGIFGCWMQNTRQQIE